MKKIFIVFNTEREVKYVTTSKKQAEKFSTEYGYIFEQHVY